MKASSKLFLALIAVAALSVVRPALGDLMMNRDVQLRSFADPAISTGLTGTATAWMPNGRDDVSRIEWRSDMEKLLLMRQKMRDGLVRPAVDPGNIVPAPGVSPGVSVPDGGSTLLLLGFAFLGFAAMRVRLSF